MSYENYNPITPVVPTVNGTPILVFGILSLFLGCIPGIILALIGKKKAKEITDQGIELTGTAKVGSILNNVGFWVGIASTILVAIYFVIYFFVIIVAALSSM